MPGDMAFELFHIIKMRVEGETQYYSDALVPQIWSKLLNLISSFKRNILRVTSLTHHYLYYMYQYDIS